MKLGWLLSHFENSPAIGLLRSRHAPFLIDFFLQQFKYRDAAADGVQLGQEELSRALRDYQEHLWQSHPEVLTGSASDYLTEWSGPEKRYLRRYLDSDYDEPLFELTAATESVLTFLDHVARREQQFVGTESRLKRIIETLADLAIGASEDAQQRLQQLHQKREEIDKQIREIEASGSVEVYHDTAIRERFATVLTDLVQLQGDFRAVEDRFKEIARDVQKQQLISDATRGEILGEALDAEDRLKTEDQGISFDEFAKLILSPAKQEHVESIIRQVTKLEGLTVDHDGTERLRDMVPALTSEARKVLRMYQRLSTTLRRLLDHDARSERRRLGQVLDEIRSVAVGLADHPRRDEAFQLSIDHQIKLLLPLERSFWSPPTEFDSVDFQAFELDDDDRLAAFSDLALLKSLDWVRLRKQIRDVLGTDREVGLPQVLSRTDTADAVDVMGLIQIAHEDEHRIDLESRESVMVRLADGREACLEVPTVVYVTKKEAHD